MTFGEQVNKRCAQTIVDAFLSTGSNCIDTAYLYCGGDTEKMLGELITPQQRKHIYLATKTYPSAEDGLSASSVKNQLETSLVRLNTSYVDLFYLHWPHLETPIDDTLHACWQLYREGKFKRFGLSNYAAWQVAEIYHKCESSGWMKPTVYQGMYNALTRDVERELIPCLRNYGIEFYAYNPLAGGLLTGKHRNFNRLAADGRFKLHQVYRDRYWDKLYFSAMDVVLDACDKHDVAPTAAALRWLKHHSCLLQDEDGIILGASSPDQFEQSMSFLQQDPLPTEVVAAYDHAWKVTQPVCVKYFRP